ncbi:MAG: hypothetical protein SPI77_09555 [Corynebacterium sp.]|nr:hypothetical protein [Corynebacterium sp.]
MAQVLLGDARMRLRELTQSLYDIGDEVAEYIEHIAQAVDDWDELLVNDCLGEFNEIVDEARRDVRREAQVLAGMRQAMVSGLRAGTLSGRTGKRRQPLVPTPATVTPGILAALSSPKERTEFTASYLRHVADWVVDQTALGVDDTDAVSLPLTINRAARWVLVAVGAWVRTAVTPDPAMVAKMRGSHPPEFLAERLRIDQIVARVAARPATAASVTAHAHPAFPRH